MQLFLTNYHVLVFRWTFQKKVAKSGSIHEKARKIIDLAKTLQLFEQLPCLCISINFSRESCKKCLISWKSTRNHRCGQNFDTFRTNYDVFAFRWTFRKKVAKSASFREKARKIIHLAKILQFFEQTTMSLHFDQLSGKKLQQVPHFVKKHEKSSIWPNLYNFSNQLPCLCISMNFSRKSRKKCLTSCKSSRNHRFRQHYATFRTDYHVFAFRWTFKEKVGKSGSFREKARKIMDLVKTCNFSNKLPCFGVSMNFSANSCRNCLISWKRTKTHPFGRNYAPFSNKLPCFGVSMNL